MKLYNVILCSCVDVHVCVGKLLSTFHAVMCHTDPFIAVFSIICSHSVPIDISGKSTMPCSCIYTHGIKSNREIGFPTAQGIHFLDLFHLQKEPNA